jgi:hypothetical protein
METGCQRGTQVKNVENHCTRIYNTFLGDSISKTCNLSVLHLHNIALSYLFLKQSYYVTYYNMN